MRNKCSELQIIYIHVQGDVPKVTHQRQHKQAVRQYSLRLPTGGRHNMPRPLDLLTLKVVSESHVTWATSLPILVFLGLSVLDLGPMYAMFTSPPILRH